MTESTLARNVARAGIEGFPIIDCDVHNEPGTEYYAFLPQRWRKYLETTGLRSTPARGVMTSGGVYRLDTMPPNGMPGSDPEFAREQLLDEYQLTAAVINSINIGSGGIPIQLSLAMYQALNDYNETWLGSDERWLASINVSQVDAHAGVKEILRCRGKSDRYVQVLFDTHTERPLGNPMYWPILEACNDLGIPLSVHIHAQSKHRLDSGLGQPSYYYELRTGLDVYAQALVCSMIFEGVFDRWPNLRIGLIECDWTWIVPMAWRLDSTWRVMRDEVPDLQRKPSEYLRDHFWFSTQPAVEPELPEQMYEVFDQLASNGFADRIMFATDYPHWDMDSPFESVPRGLSDEMKRKLLAGNAGAFYGLEVPAATNA